MNFNKHFELKGKHALLSPSRYTWLRYTDEQLREFVRNYRAAEKGTELHEYAETAIRLGRKQPNTKETVNAYINDAIGFGMTPEVILKYSDVCFGTADALSFNEKRKKLRIHDLKTGVTPAKMDQLLVYAALFCLEYNFRPHEISTELRIYQNDDVIIFKPTPEDLVPVMDKIISSDKIIAEMGEI